jgi:hypothetical protein
MLSVLGNSVRLCDGINRREVLRVGGLGFTGLTLSNLLQVQGKAKAAPRSEIRKSTNGFGKAKACIVIFNYGGPSHLDIWDLKPDAPAEIRGDFKPAPTNVPGISITEHLPQLAKLANLYTIVRSMTHRDNDHAIGTYLALTGYSHPKHDILGIEPPETPLDMPSMGSIVSKLRPMDRPVFPYVTLGDLRHFGNNDGMGQNAGCLGKPYDPFIVPFVRPLNGTLDVRGVTSVMEHANGRELGERRQLLDQLNVTAHTLQSTAESRNLSDASRRAYELLASTATRDAFNLSREPQKIRDSYGSSAFSQNCLLARRLVEAGVPLVTLYSVGNRDWDTHGNNFNDLKNNLLPPMDRGVSALLKDLEARGQLDETLVIWMGDMGRTPRVNKGAGRDHWSFCYSLIIAGGGIRGGQVYGSSDRGAAYPSTNPVGPPDIAATIFHCLGIDSRADMIDQQGRPIVVSSGYRVDALLA